MGCALSKNVVSKEQANIFAARVHVKPCDLTELKTPIGNQTTPSETKKTPAQVPPAPGGGVRAPKTAIF